VSEGGGRGENLLQDFEIWYFVINFLVEKCFTLSFGVGKMKLLPWFNLPTPKIQYVFRCWHDVLYLNTLCTSLHSSERLHSGCRVGRKRRQFNHCISSWKAYDAYCLSFSFLKSFKPRSMTSLGSRQLESMGLGKIFAQKMPCKGSRLLSCISLVSWPGFNSWQSFQGSCARTFKKRSLLLTSQFRALCWFSLDCKHSWKYFAV